MSTEGLTTQEVPLGFLVQPQSGSHPGVVMIHDVWGLSDHTREMARRLAGEGFAVLAIDLYRREGEVEIRDPAAWMQDLSDPRVLEDVGAGVAFLRDLSPTRLSSNRICDVAVLGFCMGGMYALLAGCSDCGATAVVAFYGILSHRHGLLASGSGLDPAVKPREPLEAVRELGCPLLAFFGEDDGYISLADVDALETNAAETSQPVEIVRVPGVGHAFMNDTRPDAYHAERAREAWERTCRFLRGHLR